MQDLMDDEESSEDTIDDERVDKCGGGDTMALRQWVGVAMLMLVVIVFLGFQSASSLSKEQYRTSFILCFVVVCWVAEVAPIPITSMLIGPSFYLFNVCSLSDCLAGYMSNLTLLLFGSYFISIAMERHGLDMRFAHAVTSLEVVGGIPWRLRIAVMLTAGLMSMWISNTAATNILVPILLKSVGAERNQHLPDSQEQRTLTGNLLSLAYACNAGGMGTLIGTPPNLVAAKVLEDAGIEVGFVKWMAIGVPMSILVMAIVYVILRFQYPPMGGAPSDKRRDQEPGIPSKLKWGEQVTLSSFLFTLLLWLFPSVYRIFGGPGHDMVKKMMPAGVMVLVGTLPLFLVPDADRRTRVLPFSKAKQADWGIIMLVGGGVVLGKQIIKTGLGALIATATLDKTGVNNIWVLTFMACVATIFLTEITSNTATTNVLVPIVYAASQIIDPNPHSAIPPCVGVAIAASCAFMLPIATPPNYLVKDTGHVEIRDMATAGIWINLVCSLGVWILLRLIVPVVWP